MSGYEHRGLGWPTTSKPTALPAAASNGHAETAVRRSRWNPWTKDEIIALLQADAAERGRTPTQREWWSPHVPTSGVVIKHFGGWNAAIEAAGLETRPRGGGRAGRPAKRSAKPPVAKPRSVVVERPAVRVLDATIRYLSELRQILAEGPAA